MPSKDGNFSDQERVFVKEMARTSDAQYAAEKAGYRAPSSSASQLIRRPAVMAEVRRRQVERLNGTMVPLAYDHLERVLRDESAPIRAKNDAAKIVLTQAKGLDEGGYAKDLSEMSASELNAFIAASKARIAELEGEANTIEHEAAPEPEPQPEPGIFG